MLGSEQNDEVQNSTPGVREAQIVPGPRVSIQAFCENQSTAAIIQSAIEDRRMH